MTVPEDKQITLQAAAATLAISPSRLRRWADEGRIPSVRTAGGHRRFSLSAVRRLAAESGVRPTVRPVEPPGGAAPGPGREPARARPPARAAAAAAGSTAKARRAGSRPSTPPTTCSTG